MVGRLRAQIRNYRGRPHDPGPHCQTVRGMAGPRRAGQLARDRRLSILSERAAIAAVNIEADSALAAALAKVRRNLLAFLFVLYIIPYMDRINVGFASLQMN